MNRRSLLAIALSLSLLSFSASAASLADQARQAAEEWLGLVDSGRFQQSWEQAATLFKRAVVAQQWVQASSAVRGPLGGMKARREKSLQQTQSLPGAPDGQYVLMQFETIFENKAAAIETLTLMREPDGSWRVAGYFIR